MLKRKTEAVIEDLIAATYGHEEGARKRYVFAQALHGLVRLARAELLLEIRMDADKARGGKVCNGCPQGNGGPA
jgi:hypothetical protein